MISCVGEWSWLPASRMIWACVDMTVAGSGCTADSESGTMGYSLGTSDAHGSSCLSLGYYMASHLNSLP